jgi:hypothetical protein
MEANVIAYPYRNSRADIQAAPKPCLNPILRRQKYGRVRSMDEDLTFWERFFSRH